MGQAEASHRACRIEFGKQLHECWVDMRSNVGSMPESLGSLLISQEMCNNLKETEHYCVEQVLNEEVHRRTIIGRHLGYMFDKRGEHAILLMMF